MQYILTMAFVSLDYISGTAASLYNNTFESSTMRKGIFQKLSILVVLIMVALFDYAQAFVDLGALATVPVSGMVCAAFIIMEINSVMENLHKINDQIPANFSGLFGGKKE